jgi:hypothetical protein
MEEHTLTEKERLLAGSTQSNGGLSGSLLLFFSSNEMATENQ